MIPSSPPTQAYPMTPIPIPDDIIRKRSQNERPVVVFDDTASSLIAFIQLLLLVTKRLNINKNKKSNQALVNISIEFFYLYVRHSSSIHSTFSDLPAGLWRSVPRILLRQHWCIFIRYSLSIQLLSIRCDLHTGYLSVDLYLQWKCLLVFCCIEISFASKQWIPTALFCTQNIHLISITIFNSISINFSVAQFQYTVFLYSALVIHHFKLISHQMIFWIALHCITANFFTFHLSTLKCADNRACYL